MAGAKTWLTAWAAASSPDDFTVLDEWTRQAHEREAAGHPRRERIAYWAVIAVLIVVGLGVLNFMVLYFFLWAL